MSNKLVRISPHRTIIFINWFSVHHIVILFIATKLTKEKNASCHDGSSQKPEVSLKESLLEILDCCLSHEERVTDVERKCEDNHQNIR